MKPLDTRNYLSGTLAGPKLLKFSTFLFWKTFKVPPRAGPWQAEALFQTLIQQILLDNGMFFLHHNTIQVPDTGY